MRMPRSLGSILTVSLCLFALGGCGGPKGVAVNGTIVFPRNLTLKPDDYITLSFVPVTPGSPAGNATVSPEEKTFIIKGPDGKSGIVPGKYTITVQIKPYGGGQDQRKAILDDINTKYGQGAGGKVPGSQLSYEVTSDPEQSITVDLIKGTATKN
jgi:hypothetical protein